VIAERELTYARDPAATAAAASRAASLSRRIVANIAAVNVLAAVLVFGYLTFLPPWSSAFSDPKESGTAFLVGFLAFVPLALVTILPAVRRRARLDLGEAGGGGPDAPDVVALVRHPMRQAVIVLTAWLAAAAIFSCAELVLEDSVGDALMVLVSIALAGGTSAAGTFLRVEGDLRPLIADVLGGARPPVRGIPTVRSRLLLTWVLGSAFPMLALAALPLGEPAGDVAASIPFIVALGLVAGAAITRRSAAVLTTPIEDVGSALRDIEAGTLDRRVGVDQGGELGALQAGFNRMAQGLQERERLHDLFGRHVGTEVARAALERGVALGGEEREVAALFVDITGSTGLAAERSPTEVVTALNRFFKVVVDVVDDHSGLVNKFEGDAALCIFGAPVAYEDPAGDCMAAARELALRLRAEVPQLDAGIGVSAGRAVAGNVGSESRYEYTVIGDPINEAARLTELAKHRPGRVLASGAALRRARQAEQSRWKLAEEVTLRGRPIATRVVVPRS
jgi:adenylate cyclase